ncbi:MAG: LysM peptidoglycan-binding domain-containing protein, partial [Gemmatimonadetes bacterium]|nr:LysM peptidoglycan-binding domain-containing protein [Gemmatimonadota bacterium]
LGADLLGRAQYDLPVVANEWVRSEMEFLLYQRHAVVGGWLRQADRYAEWVRDVFASYGIPRDLHHLGMIESGYRPTVRSHAGAVGMWQFMPATGRGMGLRIDTLVDERMDPVRATHAAARHLRDLHRRMRGDWALAAAAYNAGEGRINRALGRYGATDFWDVAVRGDLAQETRRYVPRLYAVTIIAKDPVRFGYPAPTPAARRFAYDSVRVDLPTPLPVLAQIGSLPLSELTDLNPHLFRQIAPRNYWVWVPLGQGAPLQQAFAASEFRRRGGYAVYRVREGESLSRLAELSGVPVDRIRAMNLSTSLDNLRAGDHVRLYADAVRVLDARPVQRAARPDAPRVLGDPAPAAGAAAPDSGNGQRRGSSSSRRSDASGSERRSDSASAPVARRTSDSASAARSGATSSTRTAGSPDTRSGSGSGSASAPGPGPGPGSASGSASARPSSSSSSAPPREGSGSSGGRPAAASAPASSPRAGGAPAGRTHTVEAGETLWGIARRFEVTVDAVREANDLKEADTIRPGQTLRIPRPSSTAASQAGARESGSGAAPPSSAGARRTSTDSASAPRRASGSTPAARPSSSPTANPPSSEARAREHTVADGETLWGIARRYGTTVENLRRANGLDQDAPIRPGQKLRIPES